MVCALLHLPQIDMLIKHFEVESDMYIHATTK